MLEHLRTGNPIWVYYIDIDTGEKLMVPQLMKGIVGCKYHVDKKEFPHYRFIKLTGPAEGSFDMQRKDVRLYYRKDAWQAVEDVDLYLHLDQVTTIYDQANGLPINEPLPAGIVIKAFRRINTADGETWYELGAGQWVKYDGMRVVNNPYDEENHQSSFADQLTILPLKNVQGTIDYLPGKGIDVFDAPYGQRVATIPDGKRVNISGKLDDHGEITWYQIGDHQFVTGNYVIIDNQED
ncbi:MucBP domain-containing protein [Limosilactobacillus sp.]|uniref:MucBP domain-containing protein n=1 Tax=Limosilactobacillus sp. TaxID=2773925 RepID=UPI003F12BF0E